MLNSRFSGLLRGSKRRGWRIGALLSGILAVLLMVIVGCSSVINGTAVVDAEEAPAYRASVSAAIVESLESSIERESQRQASLTTAAIHNSCDVLSTSSVDAIRAVNTYVEALNGAGDPAPKAGPAAQALQDSATLVETSLSDALEPALSEALRAWVGAARELAAAITGKYPPDQFNAAIDKLNEAKSRAVSLCDAAY